MPFEVFRRHQRKFLAVLALMAMIAFTLDLSLFRNSGGPGDGEDKTVFSLFGRPVRRSEVAQMYYERARANLFMSELSGNPNFFGGLSDADMQDALILEREADRLQMPRTPDVAKLYLRDVTNNRLTPELFDSIYRRYFTGEPPMLVTDEQLLADIANQVRLQKLRGLPLAPLASNTPFSFDLSGLTPLDLFDSYKDQQERVSALAVAFPADDYVAKVADPGADELRTFYDKYKDQLPDPERDSPGFKIPRRVQVEYLIVDEESARRKYESELSAEQVRRYYEEHKTEFPAPPRELPVNLFAGDKDAKLTPRTTDPFSEVSTLVRERLAAEKAGEDVEKVFEAAREQVIDPFSDTYEQAEEQNETAREQGKAAVALPKPNTADGKTLLSIFAARSGLKHEVTPLMTREQAGMHLPIAGAVVGTSWAAGGEPFATYVFSDRRSVYDEIDLVDTEGRRFLAWKLADVQPEVPALDTIREEVVREWKRVKARDLALADAQALAAKARDAKGDLKAVAGNRPVVQTSPVARMVPGFDPRSPLGFSEARPNDIPEIKSSGEALRKAFFNLKSGEVQVEPNGPRSVYYVLVLNDRKPAELKGLFGPVGMRPRLEMELAPEKSADRLENWMDALRKQAGAEKLTTEHSADDGHDHG